MPYRENKKVLVLGGSGFVGYHVMRALDKAGFEIGILLHSKKDNLDIPFSGYKPYVGDIMDEKSLEYAMEDFKPDVVINLVGIIEENPKKGITYNNIHVSGTQNAVNAAQKNNVKKFIYVSANGADINGSTEYLKTKAKAEDITKDSGLNWTIFQPTAMFGWKAGFTNTLLKQIERFPVVPVIGNGRYEFQPIAASVAAYCIAEASRWQNANHKTYVIAGPEVLSMREITKRVCQKIETEKSMVGVPVWIVKLAAVLGDYGLPSPVTSDQLKMLFEGDIGDTAQMDSDFNPEQIYFDPMGDYPLF